MALDIRRPSGKTAPQEVLDAVKDDMQDAAPEGVYISAAKEMFRPDPEQPRKNFPQEMIDERQQQMEAYGQIDPIKVKPLTTDEDGKPYYPIIDGECRWRASMQSEVINRLDAKVDYDCVGDNLQKLLKQALANDEGSAGLSLLERAELYYRIKSQVSTQTEAADLLKKTESEFSRILNLRQLPDEIKQLAASNDINDPKVLTKLGHIAEVDKDEAIKVIGYLRDANEKRRNREAAPTAREIVQEAEKQVTKKRSGKGVKEKKMRPVPIKDARVVRVGDKLVLEVDRPREKHRFWLPDDVYKNLLEPPADE